MLDYTSLPTTSSPFPTPTPRSKGQKSPSVQQAQVARQLGSRNPTLQAPRQLESRIWVPGCLNLIILSSSIGHLLGRNSSPQDATGRQHSSPRIEQISLNRCSRPHRSAEWLIWAPWLLQRSPHGTRALQQTPAVLKGLQNVIKFRLKSATRHAKRQASKHPSLGSQRSAAEAVASSIYRMTYFIE